MHTAIRLDPAETSRVCARFGVERLRLFGSALTPSFDPATSDLDFLVDFLPDRRSRVDDYFGLLEALKAMTGYPVDLITTESLRNPYVRSRALAHAEDIYSIQH